MSYLTYRGRKVSLGRLGTAGIPGTATLLKLYTTASVPNLDGTGFVDLATADGYSPWTIALVDWTTTESLNATYETLAAKAFTASGSNVTNIAGAYLADATGPLMWLPLLSSVTILVGNTLTLDTVRLSIA